MTLTCEQLAPGVWRLPLPSRTLPPFEHTNSYLLSTGTGSGVLIDAGSGDPDVLHGLERILETLGVTSLLALLLTHTHPDHCAGAEAVQRRYGLPVYAHPLERPALTLPSEPLGGGTLAAAPQLVRAHHTPGHSPGHLSFEVPHARTLLVGDLLSATGSTWVGLPGGDVAAYLASLDAVEQLVQRRDLKILGPGHGPPVTDPNTRLAEVRTHRLAREAQVLTALRQPRTLVGLREAVYPDLTAGAVKAAEGSLAAQLVKLLREGRALQHQDGRYQDVETSAESQP